VSLDSRGSEISPRMHGVFEEIQQEDEKVLSTLSQNGGIVKTRAVATPPMGARPAAVAPSIVPVTHASSAKLHVDDGAAKSEGQGIAGGL